MSNQKKEVAMLPTIRNRNDVPSLFDDLFNRDFLGDFFNQELNTPAVNVSEEKDKYKIEVAAPGLNKKDFNVNVEDNVLTISSEKQDEDEEKDRNYMRKEFHYSSFSRSFTLPENVKADDIKASHNDGVLKVEVPKKEETKAKPSRQIEIK